MLNIKTVTVIGANGTMGCKVAGIFASFGGAKVYLVSRKKEKSVAAIDRAAKSVRADSIKANMIPADYLELDKCISKSDLIFESTSEDMSVKSEIIKDIACHLSSDCVVCSGTSGLSITRLAECLPEKHRSHFFGVHMFNPPYNMTLCELTSTKYSDESILKELKEYLSNVLFRTVVDVKDSPAFLANRIGFQFINEALQYAERYKDNGGIDYIDAILGPYTGRAMAPLATSDFVGLDVHKAIVDNLYNNTNDYANDSFKLPEFVDKLVKEGRLGKKSKEGLYKSVDYGSGIKKQLVYDIKTGIYRDIIDYNFPFSIQMVSFLKTGNYEDALRSLITNHSQEAEICLGFLLRYIIYSLYTSKIVGYSDIAADDVMATGFNWCPPLALLQGLYSITDCDALIKERITGSALNTYLDIASRKGNAKSSYDYRPFFRALK